MRNLLFALFSFVLLALGSCAGTRPPTTGAVTTTHQVASTQRLTREQAVDTSKAQTRTRTVTEQSTPGAFYAITVSLDSLSKYGSVAVALPGGGAQVFTRDPVRGTVTARTLAPAGHSKTWSDTQHTSQDGRSSQLSEFELGHDSTTVVRQDPSPAPPGAGKGGHPFRWLFHTAYVAADVGGALALACVALVVSYGLVRGFSFAVALWRRRSTAAEK